jgi:hypothetical protein
VLTNLAILAYHDSSYRTDTPFPNLDTFPDPSLFSRLSDEHASNIRVQADLVTCSETGTRLRGMVDWVGRTVEVETREALLNDLAELAERYDEDRWHNGSEEDEEDGSY